MKYFFSTWAYPIMHSDFEINGLFWVYLIKAISGKIVGRKTKEK